MNEIGCKSFHLTEPSGKIYSKVIGPIEYKRSKKKQTKQKNNGGKENV